MTFLFEHGKAVIAAALLLAGILTGAYTKIVDIEQSFHAEISANRAEIGKMREAITAMTEAIRTQTVAEAAVAKQTTEFNKLWYDTDEIQTQGTHGRLDVLTQAVLGLQRTYTEGVRHVNFIMGKHAGQHDMIGKVLPESKAQADPAALRVRDRHPE